MSRERCASPPSLPPCKHPAVQRGQDPAYLLLPGPGAALAPSASGPQRVSAGRATPALPLGQSARPGRSLGRAPWPRSPSVWGARGPWPGRVADGALACREESSNGWQRAEVIRLEQDVFTALAGRGKLYVYKTDGFWSQIKSAGYGRGLRLDPPQPRGHGSHANSLAFCPPALLSTPAASTSTSTAKPTPKGWPRTNPEAPSSEVPPCHPPAALGAAPCRKGTHGARPAPLTALTPSPRCRERLHPPHRLHRQHGSGECRGAPRG